MRTRQESVANLTFCLEAQPNEWTAMMPLTGARASDAPGRVLVGRIFWV
jgi:hypothetical protein